MLKSPSQTNLSRCLMVLCSKASNDLVLHQLVIVSGKRRIGLNCDVVLSAEVNGLSFPQQGMELKLVDSWLYLRKLQEVLEMMFEEIADTNVSHFPFFLQLNQSSPCFMSTFSVFRTIDIILGHSRPMNNQQIQVSNLQPLQNTLTSLPSLLITLLPRRDLTSNENLTAVDLHFLQHLSYHFFVLVDRCSVDVSVTCFQGPSHSFVTFLPSQLISPITNVRNLIA